MNRTIHVTSLVQSVTGNPSVNAIWDTCSFHLANVNHLKNENKIKGQQILCFRSHVNVQECIEEKKKQLEQDSELNIAIVGCSQIELIIIIQAIPFRATFTSRNVSRELCTLMCKLFQFQVNRLYRCNSKVWQDLHIKHETKPTRMTCISSCKMKLHQ